MESSKHQCPRPGCLKRIDNRIFCCAPDWSALSQAARKEIGRTAQMGVLEPERRWAIDQAQQEWRKL